MDLTSKIAGLYNHWDYHTTKPSEVLDTNIPLLKEIAEFITERMKIWELKDSGYKPPFSNDPILSNYRFCNIYRELDRQTIDIHRSLSEFDDNELWFLNLMFNRFLCKPETYELVGSLSFNEEENRNVYRNLIELPNPKYGSAYVFPISVIQNSEWPTREAFFTKYLPLRAKELFNKITTFKRISVTEALPIIMKIFGFNFKFHFTEILIDFAYKFPEFIDLNKQFPIGPGSLPTMKKINPKGDPEVTNLELVNKLVPEFPYLQVNGKKIYLSAENWEGIGCEFRKYTNLKAGQGRRRKYKL